MMEMKRCCRCGEIKPTGQFHKRNRSKDSLCSYCRTCTAARSAIRYSQLIRSEPQIPDRAACTICKTDKPADEFYRRARGARLMSRCKECWKQRQRDIGARRAERPTIELPAEIDCQTCHRILPVAMFALNNTKTRGVQSRCKDCHRDIRYKLEIGEYNRRLEEQGGVCAICKCEPPLNKQLEVDHCHLSDRVRGLLCGPCNRLLGAARDSVKTLLAAAEYLEGGGL